MNELREQQKALLKYCVLKYGSIITHEQYVKAKLELYGSPPPVGVNLFEAATSGLVDYRHNSMIIIL